MMDSVAGNRSSWFEQMLAVKPEEQRISVQGTDIELRSWGKRGAPGVLFVHGMLAHARWWDFIAPMFADHYRCTALSFSGMGLSGWRKSYSVSLYVEELRAAIQQTGLNEGPALPLVVAHSFGTVPARRLAEQHGDELSGLVILDSPVRAAARYTPFSEEMPLRPYPTIDESVERFRLLPPQTCENDFLLDYISRTGLRRKGDYWVRSFDPCVRARMSSDGFHWAMGKTGCPVAFIYGEDSSVVDAAAKEYLAQSYPDNPRIEIPHAAHHVMLDQPLALADKLNELFTYWPENRVL